MKQKRGWKDGACHGRIVPEDRRDHRRFEREADYDKLMTRIDELGIPDEGYVVVL